MLIFALFVRWIFQIRVGYAPSSWDITEFLINYEAGFIRRGLIGQLLFIFKDSLNVYWTILGVSLFSFLGLIVLVVNIFRRHQMSLWLLGLPFLLGGMIILDFWVRKDSLLLLMLYILIRYISDNRFKNILISVLILIVTILIHEAIIFVFFPFFLLHLYFLDNRSRRQYLIFLPVLVVLYFVVTSHGDNSMAAIIWNSWIGEFNISLVSESSTLIHGSIGALAWTFKDGLGYIQREFSNFDGQIYSPLFWILILGSVYAILVNTLFSQSDYRKKIIFSNVLLIQLLGIIPLFIIGWDYGRWIFYWTISSILLFDSCMIKYRWEDFVFLNRISEFLLKITSRLNKAGYMVLAFFLGFPKFGWNLSYATDSVPVLYILRVISLFILKIGEFF